jgi:hypothetical protein
MKWQFSNPCHFINEQFSLAGTFEFNLLNQDISLFVQDIRDASVKEVK